MWSSPAVSDAAIYVGSGNNKLYALDAFTGDLCWSYETEGAIYSSPVFVGGVVYVGSSDNNIYAIGVPFKADAGTETIIYLVFVVIVAVVVLAAVSLLFSRRHLKS